MAQAPTKPVTIEEFEQLPLERAELVRGEIVEMPPPGIVHCKVCLNAAVVLDVWCRQHGDFEAFSNDGAVVTSRDPDSVRGPDVAVIRRSRIEGGELPVGSLRVAPELVVEVKSPSNTWSELVRKVGEYLACGVPEAWIVDSVHRRVHVYTTDDEPTILEADDPIASTALPGFTTPVAELFRGL